MNHTDILNRLAAVYGLERYLEIGVRNPASNFDKIECRERTGVDRRFDYLPLPYDSPRMWELFHMTSDEFFTRYDGRRFGLVFVDGNHRESFVRRDVNHALWAIGGVPEGRVVMHDCNPPDARHTHPSLCGTAYRVFLECRANPNYECYCLDCDYGVGVIKRTAQPSPLELPTVYGYADFAANRAEWLNLIDPEDWNPA